MFSCTVSGTELNISCWGITLLKHKFPSELLALFNSPMKMGWTCAMVTRQVSWLCLIMRYMWKADVMNRQVMTSLTIWLLTSESVKLSLLWLD